MWCKHFDSFVRNSCKLSYTTEVISYPTINTVHIPVMKYLVRNVAACI